MIEDPYIDRCGGESVLRSVLSRPDLIRALGDDVDDAIRASEP